MKFKLLLIAFLNCFFVCYAQLTYVPDDGFEQILIDLGYDSGPLDDFVPTANINGVTRLNIISLVVFDPDVNDFTGIEDFTALTTFTANFVSAPNIDLSSNNALVSVTIVGRFLTDVNLKNGNNTIITNLSILSTNGNGLAPVRICIDDIAYANVNFQDLYATGNYFVENCTALVNSITGTTFFDADNNAVCDATEIVSTNGHVVTTGANYSFTSYLFQENYATYSLDSNVTTQLQGIPSYFTVTPVSQNIIYTNTGNTNVVDYCITTNATINDLQVESYAVTASKPGFDTRIRIKYKNIGSTLLSGTVVLNYNDMQEAFNNADGVSSGISVPFSPAVTPNTLTWNYSNIAPFETRYIDAYFTINTPIEIINTPVVGGDIMTYTTAITPVTGDATSTNNLHVFNDLVVNAYDPNDVTCFEGDKISLAQVPDYLTYRIRFQNTGSAAATNILVSNDIDFDLDLSTLQLIASSHPHTTTVTNDTEIKFTFLNINLPDSTSDEPGSNGWVLYKMKPNNTSVLGDVFENTASIYFDYNAPIITNTATTTVSETTFVPDDDFEQALIDLGYDSGPLDDHVFTSNVDNITSLDVSNENIANLMGIEAFTSLSILDASTNALTALNLNSNLNLTSVTVNNNLLTAIDLRLHVNLIAFNCFQNSSLAYLNLRNGNNVNMNQIDTTQCPSLTCIEVDDATYATTNWTNIDAASTFVNNQAECALLSIAGIDEVRFDIYPNPVSTLLTVYTENEASYTFTNISGQIISAGHLHVGDNSIDVSAFAVGLYLIHTRIEGSSFTDKILVK
jgi:uncharacterized repeat protein (TIGR01451 family)